MGRPHAAREAGTADFTPDDAQLIASLSGPLAQGLRRALLVAAVKDGNHDNAEVGVLVLAEDDSIELANAAAQEWLDELRQPEHAHLPIVIQAVATRARRAAAGDGSGAAARTRIRTASGRWLVATGSMLGVAPGDRAAVILEEAQSPALAPLIADAYGLSARERSVTQLVAQGLPHDQDRHRVVPLATASS